MCREQQREERQRIAIGEWRVVCWSGYQPRQETAANSEWRLANGRGERQFVPKGREGQPVGVAIRHDRKRQRIVERQRIANSQWQVDCWSGYQPRPNYQRQRIANGEWRVERQRIEGRQQLAISDWRLVKRQQEASRKWRIVSRQSPVANRPSPVATFRLAFTLTELLVAIAILSILFTLLFIPIFLVPRPSSLAPFPSVVVKPFCWRR